MGSEGMKRSRKGGSRRHLPKVGTRDHLREEQHLEREAVAEQMGLGGLPVWLKWGAASVAIVVVVIAVLRLIMLD